VECSETVEQLTLFQPDTHASLFPTPGSDEARKITAISGRKLSGSLRKSGPVGLLAKMLLDTSLWGSTTCLLTWGGRVTPRKHFLYQLRPSAPATDETEFSLWPTPTANDAQNSSLPPSAKDWDSIPGAIMREGHTAQEGQLNPEWVEVLMNFPPKWTDVE